MHIVYTENIKFDTQDRPRYSNNNLIAQTRITTLLSHLLLLSYESER